MQGDDVTNSNTPSIAGTGVAGDTVTLYDGTISVGTGTVSAAGTWSVATTTTLSDGSHDLTATESSAGTASPSSSVLTVTINTETPARPGGLTLGPSNDSGVQGDDITTTQTEARLPTAARWAASSPSWAKATRSRPRATTPSWPARVRTRSSPPARPPR